MILKPISISFIIHLIFITLLVTGLPSLDKYDDMSVPVIEIELINTSTMQEDSKEDDLKKEEPKKDKKKYSSTPNIKPSMRSDESSKMNVVDSQEEVALNEKMENEKKTEKKSEEVFSIPTEKPSLNKINDKLLTNLNYNEEKEESKKVTALLDKFPDDRDVGEEKENQLEKSDSPKKNNSITSDEISNMKRQVEMCWNPPRGVRGASDQKVQVLINLNRDGSIIDVTPITRANDDIKKIAIESATRAVKQCQPYEIPIDKYELWKEIKFTFDPRNMLGG